MIKIKTSNDVQVFITSDTHYGHKNICRGVTDWRLPNGDIPIDSTRDFLTIKDMNDAIVKNINNVVRENDILIHLGDWSFKGIDNIFEFRSRINCQTIHLILGNHDKFIKFDKNDCSKLFSSIQHIQTFKIDDFCFVASHYPIQSWENLKLGWSHLHGHMHYSPTNKLGFGRKMDIGIDGHIEFRPYNIVNEIMPIMNEREIDTHLKNDHHLNNVLNNN